MADCHCTRATASRRSFVPAPGRSGRTGRAGITRIPRVFTQKYAGGRLWNQGWRRWSIVRRPHPITWDEGSWPATKVYSDRVPTLDRELLHGDALVERMLGIEQQSEDVGAVDADVDRGDVADLDLVGDRRDRPLAGIEHAQLDGEIVGDQRAAPAPGAERADRGQRHQLRVQRQDR